MMLRKISTNLLDRILPPSSYLSHSKTERDSEYSAAPTQNALYYTYAHTYTYIDLPPINPLALKCF